jgi:adenine/guanine/hypoxanthine permease
MTLARESKKRPALPKTVVLFVNGTLMRGEPLHGNLAGANFLGPATTAPRYRLFSVRDVHPAMLRQTSGPGAAVKGELYRLSMKQLATTLEGEPTGLGIGVVELADMELCLGVCWVSSRMPRKARDISKFGGWREYKRRLAGRARPRS